MLLLDGLGTGMWKQIHSNNKSHDNKLKNIGVEFSSRVTDPFQLILFQIIVPFTVSFNHSVTALVDIQIGIQQQ